MIKEIWKDIDGYDYKISSLGNVLRVYHYKTKSIKPYIRNKYLTVHLCKNNKPKHFFIHRLVAEAFIPNPDKKPQVNHINGIKTDNRIENLEWVTHSENNLHCYRVLKRKLSCLGKFGKEHPASKTVIRIDIKTGEKKVYSSIKDAANDNFVTSSCISSCCYGRSKTSAGYKWIFSIRG